MSGHGKDEMAAIRAFIGSVEWRFAKTMAFCPHFYNTYFDIDDYKYWVMSDTVDETTQINRAKLP